MHFQNILIVQSVLSTNGIYLCMFATQVIQDDEQKMVPIRWLKSVLSKWVLLVANWKKKCLPWPLRDALIFVCTFGEMRLWWEEVRWPTISTSMFLVWLCTVVGRIQRKCKHKRLISRSLSQQPLRSTSRHVSNVKKGWENDYQTTTGQNSWRKTERAETRSTKRIFQNHLFNTASFTIKIASRCFSEEWTPTSSSGKDVLQEVLQEET